MYKKMYYKLFNTITDAINETNSEKLREILKKGQIETEEMYISQEKKIIEYTIEK